jgi:hypothetical protein
MENKNQLAQDINSIEEIDNNPEPVIEITTPTPNTIEDMIDPIPEFNEDVVDIPTTAEAVPVIEERIKPKNTVRYIDGGFTF